VCSSDLTIINSVSTFKKFMRQIVALRFELFL